MRSSIVILAITNACVVAASAFVGAEVRCSQFPRKAQTSRRGAATAISASVDNSEKAGLGLFAEGRPDGVHGTGFRFMPMSAMSPESAPVLLCIAGAYPGVTVDQFLSPQPLPFAPKGQWNYHRLTGDAAPTGFVVLPGSDLLDAHPNTIAVVCTSESLGLELPDGQVHEVIALIDRGDAAVTDLSQYQNSEFYAFADPEGQVHIRWFQDLPAGWRLLGRLLYTQLPYKKKPGSGGGFAELSDDFEF